MDIFNNAQKAWLLLEDGTIYEDTGWAAARTRSGSWSLIPV